MRVDHSALMRGWAEGDELCDISGVGPVSVSTVRQLWPDAVVKAIITKGQAVTNVTHLGRRATEAMVAAMQLANPGCSNSTCDNDRFVQLDHRLGYANVGRTRLDELDLLCSHCHGLKTNSNWQLVAGGGPAPPGPSRAPRSSPWSRHPPVAGRKAGGGGRLSSTSSTRATTWPEPPSCGCSVVHHGGPTAF